MTLHDAAEVDECEVLDDPSQTDPGLRERPRK
jgi:hypothetical protein